MATKLVRNANSQNCIAEALRNKLVLDKICSFLSPDDLMNLRGVNHFFHDEATKRLRLTHHKPVNLQFEWSMHEFLELMLTRLKPDTPFPFSAYKLNLRSSITAIKEFVLFVGRYIHRLSFQDNTKSLDLTEFDVVTKIILLLSRTLNLVQIDITTLDQIQVPNTLLSIFQRRYFQHLQVINMDHIQLAPSNPNSTPLLSILIKLSPRLHYGSVGVVSLQGGYEENQSLNIFRTIAQHPSHPTPYVSNAYLAILPPTFPIIRELRNLHLRIVRLETILYLHNPMADQVQLNAAEVQNLVQKYMTFLGELSPTLRTLYLIVRARSDTEQPVNLEIPPLSSLNELHLRFLGIRSGGPRNLTFSVPLTGTQFPTLRRLHIGGNQKFLVPIGVSPLVSVQTFHTSYEGCLERNPWHRIIPNVSLIRFYTHTGYSEWARSNFMYILQHFTLIIDFEMELHPIRDGDEDDEGDDEYDPGDYWLIMTAEDPRPESRDELFYDSMIHKWVPHVDGLYEVIDGVYQYSSLGNVQFLQRLVCRPVVRANLDAIVYMTRLGELRPLKILTIMGVRQDLNMGDDEVMLYGKFLAKVHKEVRMMPNVDKNWRTNPVEELNVGDNDNDTDSD